MSIKIYKDSGTAEPFTLILSTRGHVHLGEILNACRIVFRDSLNAAGELHFEVYKYADGKRERLWDEISDLKFVYVKELDAYFEINVALSENDTDRKIITARSACECELSQRMLYNIEINTEADIARDDYKPVRFYDPSDPSASLLDKILEKAPAYSIKRVEPSLMTMQRSFSVSDTSIYDFLTGECAEEFECIFLFDSVDRSISVYDLNTICDDCGFRGNYSDICPECGSRNLRYFGDDTTILVSTENLTDEIHFETDVGSVKNCFKLEAGDEVMTAAVMTYIPSGDDRLIYFSDEQLEDMPKELREKIKAYNRLYDSYADRYHEVMDHIYECIEKITYYTSKQMPNVSIPNPSAKTEADKLTYAHLNPLSLSSLTSYTSLATVNSAVINYAKVFVKSGFVKVEVDSGASFRYNGKTNGISTGTWTGRLKVTNYSNKEDVAYSSSLTLTVNDDYMSFMNEKILKNIAENNTEDGSVYNVLKIKSIDSFRNALKLYGLNRLISFRDAVNGVLCILLEANGGTSDSELYSSFYAPYYEKLNACKAEILLREKEIESWQKKKEQYESQKEEIQDILDIRKFLGGDLYSLCTTYIRESKYSNSNYISDGLSDDAVFERAQEFLERARKELIKSSYYQHSIRADMYNLLLMDEFAPIVNHFVPGNWIRVRADEKLYRLRLVSYEINFDSLCTISTEFSDMTRTADGMNDINSILNQAESMASSYPSTARQASDGHDADMVIEKLRAEGLDSALYQIKNADSEEITFGKNGLLARSYDDISETYSDKQLIVTHNILAYTIDGWRSTKCALGEMKLTVDGRTTYEYGLNSDFCISSKIVAGNIYSANYSSSKTKGTRFCLDDGTFTLADGKIVFDGRKLKLKGIEIDWSTTNESETMWAGIRANAEGITAEAARAVGVENTLSTTITATADAIRTEANNTKDELTSSITQTAKDIRSELKSAKDGLESSITQTAKDIRSEVKSTKEGLESSITQKADEISRTIASTKEGLENNISETAEGINKTITDKENGLINNINETAKGINKTITDLDTGLSAQIKENADNITQTVSDMNGKFSEVSQSIDGINRTISDPKTGLVTKISENAGEIAKTVEDMNGKFSKVNQSIDGLDTEVNGTDGKFSKLKQSVNELKSDVYDKDGNSRIVQNADNINQRVEKNGVISAINLSSEEALISSSRLAKIKASKIELEGLTTINSYFKIKADGSMECDNATIKNTTGTNLDVQSGKIGSFVITDNAIDGSSIQSGGYAIMGMKNAHYAFSAGQVSPGGARARMFSVGHNGQVECEKITICRNMPGVVIGNNYGGGGGYHGYVDIKYNGNYAGDIRAFSDALEVRSESDLAVRAGDNNNYINLCNHVRYYGELTAGSSRKYKENIIEISEKDAEALMYLVPVEFDYKETRHHSSGLIAEDTYKVLPQIVSLKDGEPDGIDYIKLIPFLLKKVQMQEKVISELRSRITGA